MVGPKQVWYYWSIMLITYGHCGICWRYKRLALIGLRYLVVWNIFSGWCGATWNIAGRPLRMISTPLCMPMSWPKYICHIAGILCGNHRSCMGGFLTQRTSSLARRRCWTNNWVNDDYRRHDAHVPCDHKYIFTASVTNTACNARVITWITGPCFLHIVSDHVRKVPANEIKKLPMCQAFKLIYSFGKPVSDHSLNFHR